MKPPIDSGSYGPLVMPLAVKIGLFVAFLLALNAVAPGIPQAVLVLVVMYAVLTHAGQVAAVLSNAADDFSGALGPA